MNLNLILADSKTIIIAVIAVIVILLIIILGWIISTSNGFKRMLVKIDESESGIDVALQKRFDLLTKSLAAVKGFAEHEKNTLKEVIAMRSPAAGLTMQEKADYSSKLDSAMKSINVVVEQYPTIKASENFKELQEQISEVEEHLQAARRVYNQNVSSYNRKIVVFPSSIIAGGKYKKRPFFEAADEKRKDVEIKF